MARPLGEDPGSELLDLKIECGRLREVAWSQWESNHAEHCSRDWPHDEGEMCHWPLPVVLGGPEGVWRPYS